LNLFFSIASYEGNLNWISLDFNSNGETSLQLPQGPHSDAYKIYLGVNIIDDANGVTTYNITTPVSVSPNVPLLQSLTNSIFSNGMSNQAMTSLNSGDLFLVTNNVIALSILIKNAQGNYSDQSQYALIRDYMAEKLSQLSVTNVNSIKGISSSLSSLTEVTEHVSAKTAVK
jgi:hypothetical protein